MMMSVYDRRNGMLPRMMRTLALAAAFLLALPLQALASGESGADDSAGTPLTTESAAEFLDAFFASEHTAPHYTGAAVVIVKDGEVIASAGYGYADAEQQTSVDPGETIFRMASVSKTFAAVAVMQLVEQGKIDLHEDIRAYLPGIEIDNPFDVPVTVANLLEHRSGFEVRDPKPDDLHTDFELYVSIEEQVKENMPPVVREPGTAYMYDNFAYQLLGLIVENVSGMPYEAYMETHLFKPLGMDSAGFLLDEERLARLATGYSMPGAPVEPYVFKPTIMPEGGMLATAEDIGKFMIAFLNEGETPDGARILSAESVAAMSEYRSAMHPLVPDTTYGFEAASQLPLAGSSPDVLTKLGDLPGNSSMLLLLPKEETGVFLTYNQMSALRDIFYAQFMPEFFPEYAGPADLQKFGQGSGVPMEAVVGLYADLRLRSLVYSVEPGEDGSLIITDALVGPRVLRPAVDNLFVDELSQRFAAFRVDEDGAVYLKETLVNPLGYARKGEAPAGYTDVDAASPYAPFILGIQSLGYYPNEAGLAFEPERPVTRAELVYHLIETSGLGHYTWDAYTFQDIADHPLAQHIQSAAAFGLVTGSGDGNFDPDRPATRQEAAVMIWNVYKLQYPDELFSGIPVEGDTAAWALPAVRMMAAFGLHGPEVTAAEDGTVRYDGSALLTRQEEAALLFKLLLTPTDQIAAGLMQQQAAEAEAQAGGAEAQSDETAEQPNETDTQADESEAMETEEPQADETEAQADEAEAQSDDAEAAA